MLHNIEGLRAAFYPSREIYYWDSYWVIRGLLQCEMAGTVKGILLNFIHLIKKYGLIPNGGRSYYLNRSQPPLFIPMVRDYIDATNDISFLRYGRVEIIKSNKSAAYLSFSYFDRYHNFNTIMF